MNQQLYAFTSAEKFATFYFGIYDDRVRQLTYTNAGHPPPIVIRDGETLRLETNGTVVGAFPFSEYGESRIVLAPATSSSVSPTASLNPRTSMARCLANSASSS